MKCSLCTYHPERGVKIYNSLDGLDACLPDDRIWVDIESSEAQPLSLVAARFGLHELSVEDCLTPGHTPKIDDFGNYLFIILRSMRPLAELEDFWPDARFLRGWTEEKDPEAAEEEFVSRKVGIYLSERFVVTYRRVEVSWLDALVRQAFQDPGSLLAAGTDVVAHRVVDVLIDRFMRGLHFFERMLERMEQKIMRDHDEFEMGALLDVKRTLLTLREISRAQRIVISKLANDPSMLIPKMQRRYFKDIDDHATDILNDLDKEVDTLHGLRDAYFTYANMRLGDTMRVLAVITTLVAPVNVLVGVYGMNFEAMPLLHNPSGFWLIMSLIVCLTLLMLVFFRRRKWM